MPPKWQLCDCSFHINSLRNLKVFALRALRQLHGSLASRQIQAIPMLHIRRGNIVQQKNKVPGY